MDGWIRNEMFAERNDATIRSSFLPFIIAQHKTISTISTNVSAPNVSVHWQIGLNGQSGARFVLLLILLLLLWQ
jgi:hypothetical protein